MGDSAYILHLCRDCRHVGCFDSAIDSSEES